MSETVESACPPLEELEPLVAGATSAHGVAAHVSACQACRQMVDRMRGNNTLLNDMLGRGAATSATDCAIPGYQVLREIHRGGQGVVYQAVQKSTSRKVAIKVMKEGPFASVGDKARFEREVQILAQLQHPNIVAVHNTGVAAGCHFFVMDYISGQPLDAYIASAGEHGPPAREKGAPRGLSVERTLKLFAKICGAVNAAHLRGVIHRDLKPGNIRIDAEGEPHILDFGLAKVATPLTSSGQAGDDGGVAMTMTGQFIGSLPWASPEQAEGAPGKVDVRTDVYSLGVVLYYMLTDKFPYEVVGNIRDVLDRIIKSEAVRPSTIRGAARRCGGRINDEVDTIVLKCLSKERERRYQTAGELARDVERYLRHEPIEAKRDSGWYLLRKTLARYRTAAIVAGAFVVVLAVSSITLTIMHHRQGMLLDEVKYERDRATESASRATRVQEFLRKMLASIDPNARGGGDLTVRSVLDRAAGRIETDFAEQAEIQAVLHDTIGRTYLGLQLLQPAQRHLERAVELYRQHVSEEPMALADALYYLSSVWRDDEHEREQALSQCREALALFVERLPANDERVLKARALEGVLLGQTATPAERDAADAWAGQTALLLACFSDDQLARFPADFAGAVAESRRLQAAGDISGAGAVLHRWRIAFYARIRELCLAGRPDAAAQLLRDHYEPVLDVPWLGSLVPVSLINAALYDLDRNGENAVVVETLLRESIVLGRKISGDSHPNVAMALSELARLLREQGRLNEAEPPREALGLRRKLLGDDDPGVAQSMSSLAEILESKKDFRGAEGVQRERLDLARRRQPADEGAVAAVLARLGMNLSSQERYVDAEPLLRECLSIRERVFRGDAPEAWLRYNAMSMLGGALLGQGSDGALPLAARLDKLRESEALLLEAYERMSPPRDNSNRRRQALERIVRLYDVWNAAQPAQGWDRKAAAWRARLEQPE